MQKLTKTFTALLLIALFAISVTACSPKEALPVAQYTLTAEYMQEYIDGMKEGYIVKDNSFPNDYDDAQIITLGIAEKEYPEFEMAGIISGLYEGERSLSLTLFSASSLNFNPEYGMSHAGEKFDVDSSEKVIKFATNLFGGFYGEDAVYKAFKKEFGKKNTVNGEVDEYNKSRIITWKSEVDGIDCEIRFYQPDVNKDEMYLRYILFQTDAGVFEERQQKKNEEQIIVKD